MTAYKFLILVHTFSKVSDVVGKKKPLWIDMSYFVDLKFYLSVCSVRNYVTVENMSEPIHNTFKNHTKTHRFQNEIAVDLPYPLLVLFCLGWPWST